jgi:hypothetical protein
MISVRNATADPALATRLSTMSTAATRVATVRRVSSIVCTLLLFGCAQTPPPAPTAAPDSSIVPSGTQPPVVKAPDIPVIVPKPAEPVAVVTPRSAANARAIATTAALTPDGKTRYECITGIGPSVVRAAIALPPGTERICSRFPAMGPCQYERDACRAQGGRVIRFDGTEITKDVEGEYDRQVQRFRLNAG